MPSKHLILKLRKAKPVFGVVFGYQVFDNSPRLPNGEVIVVVVDEGRYTPIGVEIGIGLLLVVAFWM